MQKIIISSIILLAFFIGIGTGIVMEETKPIDAVTTLKRVADDSNTDPLLSGILNTVIGSFYYEDLERLANYTSMYALDCLEEMLSYEEEEEPDDTAENIKT